MRLGSHVSWRDEGASIRRCMTTERSASDICEVVNSSASYEERFI